MIFIIRALSKCGKDDEDYDSLTSRDETSDFTKRKKRGEKKAKRKKGQRKKRRPKKIKNKKGNTTILFSTLVLQSSGNFVSCFVTFI